MSIPRVLVVVLNWRQPEVTLECVEVVQSMVAPGSKILVVDNGSADGSSEKLATELPPSVRLLALPDNIGFAGGCNAGLRMALDEGYEYAMLLNNDAFPAPDMLAQMLDEIAADIGLLSPKILYEAQPSRIWFAGARRHPLLLELRDRGQGSLDGPAWEKSRDVDYLLGTCLLVNLAAARRIGLLNERYFMYYEDLDWSLRYQQAGFRLRLVAGAKLYHRVAYSSGGTDTPTRRYHLARSSVIFFRRYAEYGQPILIFLYRLGSAVSTTVRLLARGHGATTIAYWRGLKDGFQAGNWA